MNYRIPSSRPCYDRRDREALERVLASGHTAEGSEARKLIEELGALMGLDQGVVTSSGTTAFHLLLTALGVGTGDEVILPSYACQSLLHPILHAGARPVLADVDERSFCLTAPSVRPHLTDRTALVVLVHTFGYPAGDPELFDLDVPVLEDVAQALGARREGEHVGSSGMAALGSLYATKQLAAGQGGFLLTGDEQLAAELRDLKNYDEREEYRPAFNASLSDLQSALARSQLEKLPRHRERRGEIVERFNRSLEDLPGVRLPDLPPGHALYRYVIRVESSRSLRREAQRAGIEIKRPVFRPLHRDLDSPPRPVSQQLHETAVLLPNHPGLNDEQVGEIIGTVESEARTGGPT